MADNARRIALEIKNTIDTKAGYSNLALRSELSKAKLSRRDKALVTELVSGTLRRQGTLDWIISIFSKVPPEKIESKIKNILRLALYQIEFIDNIPDYAAINEAVEAAKSYAERTGPFVNGLLRTALRKKDLLPWPDRVKKPAEFISIKYSHPLWLVKKWLRDMGPEETEKICYSDNLRPALTLRANFLNNTRQSLITDLKEKGVDAKIGSYSQEAIIVISGSLADYGFNTSHFYVQNEASILVAHALNPQPGETIIDICCGPGGKTTHLGELMKNKGEILAVEINNKRMKLVTDNCDRLGITIVKPVIGDATKEMKSIPMADKILVDAPCSGLGVLSRRPDLRWRREEQDIAKLANIQYRLLKQAAAYIKKDGLIVYSVCTNTSEETGGIIDKFLNSHRDFKIEPLSEISTELGLPEKNRYIQIQPYVQGLDGMFIVALRKL